MENISIVFEEIQQTFEHISIARGDASIVFDISPQIFGEDHQTLEGASIVIGQFHQTFEGASIVIGEFHQSFGEASIVFG